MNPTATKAAAPGGVTVMSGPGDDPSGTLDDWMFKGMDIGGAGVSDVWFEGGGEAWDRWSRSRPSFAVARAGPAQDFTSPPSGWGFDDDSGVLMNFPDSVAGLVTDVPQSDIGPHVVRVPIRFVCDAVPGADLVEPTWRHSTYESIPSLREVVGEVNLRKWGDTGVAHAGSFVKPTVVRPARAYDVTFDAADLGESRSARAYVFGVWSANTVKALVSPVAEMAAFVDPELEEPGEGLQALPDPAQGSPKGCRERVSERIAQLRSEPKAEQPPWAARPADRAFADTERFVSAWPSVELQIPDIGLADDGEVNFLWKGPELHVDLGFYGDGTFSYFARARNGIRHADDDVAAGLGLPPDLLALLKA